MDVAGQVLQHTLTLAVRAAAETTTAAAAANAPGAAPENERPGWYKIVGIILAIASGLSIGVSFVLKKIGLLRANVKYNEEAGEGFGYLRTPMWWFGMTLMIMGEIFNLVAYAFADAILVTPMGALTIVVTAILSKIFLKERLSFVGWVACFLCIAGSVVIALNAPSHSAVSDIAEMQRYFITPGFLSYTGVIILICLFLAFWAAPRYGKKSMMVYISICGLIGGPNVVALQGVGTAVLTQIGGKAQFNGWFIYILILFLIVTLLVVIVYLNKALNIFNAAMVTPTYYVFFTSSVIISSIVLFQGLKGTAVQIINVVMGFLVICSGVILLQLAKSAKEVSDSKVLSGDLNEIRTVAEVEEPEYEPRADTLHGSASIVRAMSRVRTQRQINEVKRIHDEMLEPVRENEHVEWDGLRRRKTVSSHGGSVSRQKSVRPPLGMAQFPDDVSEPDSEVHPGFFGRIGRMARAGSQSQTTRGHSPVPMTSVQPNKQDTNTNHDNNGMQHTFGLPAALQRDSASEYTETAYKSIPTAPSGSHIHFVGSDSPSRQESRGSNNLHPHDSVPNSASGTRRQFSFQNVFTRNRADSDDPHRPVSRGALSFSSRISSREYPAGAATTEEERLGLVHGDSRKILLPKFREEEEERDEDWQMTPSSSSARGGSSSPERILVGAGAGADDGRDPPPPPPPHHQQRRRDTFDDDDDGDDLEKHELYDAPLRDPSDRDDQPGSRQGTSGGGSAYR